MTVKEVAKYYDCSVRQIDNLCRKGILHPNKDYFRGERDFDKEEVEQIKQDYNIPNHWISLQRYAKFAGVSYMAAYRMVRNGKLDACVLFNPIRVPCGEN